MSDHQVVEDGAARTAGARQVSHLRISDRELLELAFGVAVDHEAVLAEEVAMVGREEVREAPQVRQTQMHGAVVDHVAHAPAEVDEIEEGSYVVAEDVLARPLERGVES